MFPSGKYKPLFSLLSQDERERSVASSDILKSTKGLKNNNGGHYRVSTSIVDYKPEQGSSTVPLVVYTIFESSDPEASIVNEIILNEAGKVIRMSVSKGSFLSNMRVLTFVDPKTGEKHDFTLEGVVFACGKAGVSVSNLLNTTNEEFLASDRFEEYRKEKPDRTRLDLVNSIIDSLDDLDLSKGIICKEYGWKKLKQGYFTGPFEDDRMCNIHEKVSGVLLGCLLAKLLDKTPEGRFLLAIFAHAAAPEVVVQTGRTSSAAPTPPGLLDSLAVDEWNKFCKDDDAWGYPMDPKKVPIEERVKLIIEKGDATIKFSNALGAALEVATKGDEGVVKMLTTDFPKLHKFGPAMAVAYHASKILQRECVGFKLGAIVHGYSMIGLPNILAEVAVDGELDVEDLVYSLSHDAEPVRESQKRPRPEVTLRDLPDVTMPLHKLYVRGIVEAGATPIGDCVIPPLLYACVWEPVFACRLCAPGRCKPVLHELRDLSLNPVLQYCVQQGEGLECEETLGGVQRTNTA